MKKKITLVFLSFQVTLRFAHGLEKAVSQQQGTKTLQMQSLVRSMLPCLKCVVFLSETVLKP